MPYKFNPFTGTFDDSTTGPAGTVSAAGAGTAAAPGISFSGDPNTGIYSPGADQVAISTNGTGRLFVDASGNVGVNTAAGSSSGFGSFFKIKTASSSSGFFLENSSADSWWGVYGGTGTTDSAAIIYPSTGSLRIATSTSVGVGGFSERLRITAAGRVGIGTSAPTENLTVSDAIATLPVSYNAAAEILNFKSLTLESISSANQLRLTFTLPTNITGYEGFFAAELLVKASFDNVSFPSLGGIYRIRVGGVSSGVGTATSFLTTEVLFTASTSGNWTAITTGDVAVNAVSGTELTLDIDNAGGSNYRYNVFTQYAHNCSNIALSSVAA